ncbi:MAG TPA: hypothetical protein VJS44_04070 [Pyrinomonadaceae bacterium]|nr:hypothetical protein [Pyrinomonadaceae bacterium]
MRKLSITLACALLIIVSSLVAHAQTETFTDANVDYTLELPSSAWRLNDRPGPDNSLVGFVYGDRTDGYLQIRKEVVDAGVLPHNLSQRESEQKLRFLPGFIEGKEEPFSGRMNGVAFNYEYTHAGKPMAGRIYYLQADNRTIYVLRFTALRDRLARIRNQTDIIARSFRLK